MIKFVVIMETILNKESRAAIELMIADGLIAKDTAERYFPELAESEDERVRKEILQELNNSEDSIILTPLKQKRWIAWVEKQVEQKPQGKSALEAAKEEKVDNQNCVKPADRVEPKFKVGDWITDGNITIQIEAIKNNCYLYCGDCALYSTKTADKVYHLWTIQDVKDGDILAYGNDIVIFKENSYNPKDQSGCMFVYCAFNKCGYWYETGGINPTYYKPATKEQRDLLFSKMKEAGYEWDAEKKELKKIEQKSSEEYNITGIGSKHAQGKLGEMIRNLNPLGETIQRHNVWSEEDEENFARVDYACLKVYGGDSYSSDWLRKFLGIHKKWKPSDEQMKALEHAINCYSCISPTNTEEVYTLEIMKEQLKKLREK